MTAIPAARPAPTGGGTRSTAGRRRWTSRLRRARMAEIDIPYGGRHFECFGDLTKTKGGEVPACPQVSHRGEGRPGRTAARQHKRRVSVSRVGPQIEPAFFPAQNFGPSTIDRVRCTTPARHRNGWRFSGGVDGRHPTQTGVLGPLVAASLATLPPQGPLGASGPLDDDQLQTLPPSCRCTHPTPCVHGIGQVRLASAKQRAWPDRTREEDDRCKLWHT